jgi:parallel beta-helix repeat protein
MADEVSIVPAPSAGDPPGEDRCHDYGLPSVDVKAGFGARGDGARDDSAAFRKAIATGRRVMVPAGTYVLSQIDLSDGQTVVLCGAGRGVTTLKQKASPVNTAMFSIFGYSAPATLQYLEIQDLTIDGNAKSVARGVPGGPNYGTIHVMVRKMLVANAELRNSYHALRILQVDEEAIIRDNWFHDMALEADSTGGTTHHIYIGKARDAASTVWVLRNNIEQCGSGTGASCTLPSLTPGQSAGGLLYSPGTGSGSVVPQQVFVIEDNTFRNLGMSMVGEEPEAPIYLYQQADSAKILHNRLYNSYYSAITVFSSNDVEIAGNTIEGNGLMAADTGPDRAPYHAIAAYSRRTNFPTYVSSRGWSIHDNLIANTAGYDTGICACFAVDDRGNGTASDIRIVGNTFVNNAYRPAGSHMTPIYLSPTSGAGAVRNVNITNPPNNSSGN